MEEKRITAKEDLKKQKKLMLIDYCKRLMDKSLYITRVVLSSNLREKKVMERNE